MAQGNASGQAPGPALPPTGIHHSSLPGFGSVPEDLHFPYEFIMVLYAMNLYNLFFFFKLN